MAFTEHVSVQALVPPVVESFTHAQKMLVVNKRYFLKVFKGSVKIG